MTKTASDIISQLIGAPSKHLHFIRDPLKHKIAALKIAKDRQTLIQPIT